MRIYGKLTLIILGLVLVPLCLTSFLFFRVAKENVQKEIFPKLETVADLKVMRIQNFFSERKRDLVVSCSREVIQESLPILNEYSHRRDQAMYLLTKTNLDEQLKTFQMTYQYSDILLLNRYGQVVYSSNPEHSKTILNQPFLPSEVFQRAKEGIYTKDIYRERDGNRNYVMLMAGPVKDVNDKFIGEIVLEIDMAVVYEFLQDSTGLGNTGEILVVKKVSDFSQKQQNTSSGGDTEEQILFLNPLRHDPAAALTRRASFGDPSALPAQEALRGRIGSGVSVDYRGQKVLAAWRYMPSLGWGLVAKVDAEEAFLPIEKLAAVFAMIFFVTLVFAVAATLFMARSISVPVYRLCRSAEAIGRGDLNHKIGRYTKDELGELSQAFDRMSEDLKNSVTSIDNLHKEMADRQKAEEILRKSEDRYRSYIELTKQVAWITDDCGEVKEDIPSWRAFTGQSKEEVQGRGWIKAIHPDDIMATVKTWENAVSGKMTFETEYRLRRSDGLYVPFLVKGVPVLREDGTIREWVGTCIDITERKHMEEQLHKLSIYDELTQLLNRRGFFMMAQQQLEVARRYQNPLALFYIDLNNLKKINDSYGHTAGDKALVGTAAAMKNTFRKADIIGRIGGDEFVVLSLNISETTAALMVNRLRQELKKGPPAGGGFPGLSVSVGVVPYDPANPCQLEDLITQADRAMYAEKMMKKQK